MRSKKALSAFDEDKLNRIDRLKRRERGKSNGKRDGKRFQKDNYLVDSEKSIKKYQENRRSADRTKKFFALEKVGQSSDDDSPDEGQATTVKCTPSPSIHTPPPGSAREGSPRRSAKQSAATGIENGGTTTPQERTHTSSLLNGTKSESISDDLRHSQEMGACFVQASNSQDHRSPAEVVDDGYGHMVILPETPSPFRSAVLFPDGTPDGLMALNRKPSVKGLVPSADGRIQFPRMELMDASESDESAASSPAKGTLHGFPQLGSPGSPFSTTTDDMGRISRSTPDLKSLHSSSQTKKMFEGDMNSPFSPFNYTPSASGSVPRKQRIQPFSSISRSRSTSTFESRLVTEGGGAMLPSFEEFQRVVVAGSSNGAQSASQQTSSTSLADASQTSVMPSPFKTELPLNWLGSPIRSSAKKRIPMVRSHSAPTITETSPATAATPSSSAIGSPTGAPTETAGSAQTAVGITQSSSASVSRSPATTMLRSTASPSTSFGALHGRSHDAISSAIFHALFEGESSGRRRNWDSDSDSDEDGGGSSLPRVSKVDEIWFKRLMTTSLLTTTALDYAMKRLRVAQSNPAAADDDLLARYISPCFISSISEQLAFEDDRFDSPRVSILKALYRNSRARESPVRSMILTSIMEALFNRQSRCRDSMRLARLLDSEVNYIGAAGFLVEGLEGLGQTGSQAVKMLAEGLDSASGKANAWGVGEERKGVKVRDSNTSFIELLNYLVMVELTESQQHPQSLSPTAVQDGPDDDNYDRRCNSLRFCWNRLIFIQKSICLCLGCYGGALGLSAGGEFAEQPSQLTGIITCLENIFKTSALIPMTAVSELGDYDNFLPLLNNPSLGLQCFRDRDAGALLELQATSAELKMAYAVATSLLKHWPDNEIVNGLTGAGHVQMLAFLKAAELLILSPGALPIHVPRLLSNVRAVINEDRSPRTQQGSDNNESQGQSRSNRALRLPNHQRDCIQNLFLKLFSCMSSAHFKVSLQSLGLLNNPNILCKYFIDQESSSGNRWSKIGDVRIRLAATNLVSPDLLQRWDSVMDTALDSEVSSFKQDLLSRLVKALRENRTHWHPQVQTVSDQLFDWILTLD